MMKALVDTGAEVSLIKRDLVNKSLLRKSKFPVRLGAANSQQLCGGVYGGEVVLCMDGVEVTLAKQRTSECP